MGKLTLVVEDAPVRAVKNEELYKEVAEAFNELAIGKSFVVQGTDIPSLSLRAKIKGLVTLKEGEDIRLSNIHGADKKLTAIRLIKTAYKPRKQRAESQGEAEVTE